MPRRNGAAPAAPRSSATTWTTARLSTIGASSCSAAPPLASAGGAPAVVEDDDDRIVGDANVEDLAARAGFLDDEIVGADVHDRLAAPVEHGGEREPARAGLGRTGGGQRSDYEGDTAKDWQHVS